MHSDPLSQTLSALADPTRRAMLVRLSRGSATVGELAKPFKLSAPAISKHLKVLERAGLVERSKRAQWRPCTLRPEPLKEAADWIDGYRELWEVRFQQLDALLDEMKANEAEGTDALGGDADRKSRTSQRRSKG
jgi:DNA-binding transcriptional ArsR family regulator